MRKLLAAAAGAAAVTLLASGTAVAAPAARSGPVMVVGGLDNPRQLSVGPSGGLYVAEAGRGGTDCVGEGEESFCIGNTGQITRLDFQRDGTAHKAGMIRGLPSAAAGDGSFAGGANGIAINSKGRFFIASGDVPELSPDILEGQPTALLRGAGRGTYETSADLLAYELEANPDGQTQFDEEGIPLDALSNPYAALAHRGNVLVADAGANAILSVDPRGKVSTFSVPPVIRTALCDFPNNTVPPSESCDPVPTGIAKGPDGYIYVSGLGSDVPTAGRVWKMHPVTGKIVKTYGNLTGPHGIAVGPDGSIWVSELFYGASETTPPNEIGRVTRIWPSGKRTHVQVPLPAGIAVTRGHVYVAAFSIAPASGAFGNPAWSGQIWRLT